VNKHYVSVFIRLNFFFTFITISCTIYIHYIRYFLKTSTLHSKKVWVTFVVYDFKLVALSYVFFYYFLHMSRPLAWISEIWSCFITSGHTLWSLKPGYISLWTATGIIRWHMGIQYIRVQHTWQFLYVGWSFDSGTEFFASEWVDLPASWSCLLQNSVLVLVCTCSSTPATDENTSGSHFL
jgi:hypothetical protein